MTVNRVERLIINLDTTMPLSCAWGPCEKYARTPYQIRVHEHARVLKCWDPSSRHAHYAFCSDGCKDLWLSSTGDAAHDAAYRNRGLIYGMHSAGMKRMNR